MNQCPKCYRDMTPIEECGFCGHRAALPPAPPDLLSAAFRNGWLACRRKMISEYSEACHSGCDPSGAWDCAKEGTAEPDTANAGGDAHGNR